MDPVYINSFWVAFGAMLVLLMNFGLAFFYAGLVSGRNVLNTIKMSIITLGIVPIVWWLCGYSLVFSGNNAFVGGFDYLFLNGISPVDIFPNTKVLTIAFICYQAMFASIAPAIISGSGVERLKFNAYIVFIVLWIVCVYCTIAHTVWDSNGWAAQFGAFDFAGGVVVHVSAGFSGLALAVMLKHRKISGLHGKHNLPFMVLGCGMLWFGWFGFNAGSSLELSPIAMIAFENTMFAASSAMFVWILCDILFKNPKSISGISTSLIVGLVTITPAAGYVSCSSAIAIGAIASAISYTFILHAAKFKRMVDDTLDVFICHGIPGFIGGILVGVFASNKINPAIPDGAIYGNWSLLYKQLVVTSLGALFSFTATYVLLAIIHKTIGLRVNADDEESGLDLAEHGERAYNID
ncbi:ammonium transporter [Aquella oligotrophica]|uniref:Ammonium transporter n=1 Tax=Aquella oligotrophica TaxID=2067065 RepID=A0A2I7N481_9NEIS|nr:ammonium transporter [Aquella oligotrophica]AUR51280.1 ammonia channel protein [Aquella oligotrophica]